MGTRVLQHESVRSALFAFTLTRSLVFLILILVSNLTFEEQGREFGPGVQEARIELAQGARGQGLKRAILYADALWYANIARDGYELRPFEAGAQHTRAFFPLYPLLVSLRWDFRLLNFVAAVTALVCGAVLLKRSEYALGAYTLLCIIAPLSTLVLQSVARYFLTIFLAFLVLARAGRRTRVDQAIRAVLLALLGLMTALFAVHFSNAMS